MGSGFVFARRSTRYLLLTYPVRPRSSAWFSLSLSIYRTRYIGVMLHLGCCGVLMATP